MTTLYRSGTQLRVNLEALRRARDRPSRYGDILKSTKAIIFLGTPHQGISPKSHWPLQLALEKIGLAAGVKNQKLLQKLQSWSGPLADLCDDFSEFASAYQIATLFENKVSVRDDNVNILNTFAMICAHGFVRLYLAILRSLVLSTR